MHGKADVATIKLIYEEDNNKFLYGHIVFACLHYAYCHRGVDTTLEMLANNDPPDAPVTRVPGKEANLASGQAQGVHAKLCKHGHFNLNNT
jgi:hypothetical protein